MNEDVRISRRDAAVLNRRALRLMWKTNPAVFVSTGLASAVKALTPYVAIYFSARLIGELAGRRSVPVLTHLVLILLLATALLSLLGAALTRWKNAVREAGDFREQKFSPTKFSPWISPWWTHPIFRISAPRSVRTKTGRGADFP
jgi:ATP-binding cassette subfamily B protein